MEVNQEEKKKCDACGISTIKEMICDEIKKNRIYHDEINKIDSDISILENVSKIIESKNFDVDEIMLKLSLECCLNEKYRTKINRFTLEDIYTIKYAKTHRKYNEDSVNEAINDLAKCKKMFDEKIDEFKEKKSLIKPEVSDEETQKYHELLYYFKKDLIITPDQYDILNKLFCKKTSDKKAQILYLDAVRRKNVRIQLVQTKRKIDYQRLNSIKSILNFGYEGFKLPYVSKEKQNYLDSDADCICKLFNEKDNESLESAINGMSSHSFEEMSYILVKCIKNIQYLILNNVNDTIDKEIYLDCDLRNDLINRYALLVPKYMILRNHYEEFIEKHNMQEENLNREKEKQLESKIEIHYLLHGTKADELKAYAITDLKNFDPDTYQKIKYLIINFGRGVLSSRESKSFSGTNGSLKDLKELRNDQIRILYRHLGDNKYLIVGIGLKKRDNDHQMNKKMADRPVFDELIGSSSEIEKELFEILDDNARIGGRTDGKRLH